MELGDWKDRITSWRGPHHTSRNHRVACGGMGCVTFGSELIIRIHTMVFQPLENPTFGVLVNDSMGGSLLDLRSQHDDLHLKRVTTL